MFVLLPATPVGTPAKEGTNVGPAVPYSGFKVTWKNMPDGKGVEGSLVK
jgi:hypothetical protein